MSEISRYFERHKTNMTEQLHTALHAKIVKVDLQYMRADVELPLEGNPLLMQVPIATHQTADFVVRPPYKPGDEVLLVFSMKDIEPLLYGGGTPSRRQHALDDALIVGGITPFTEPLPGSWSEHEEDFVIGKRDLTSRIVLTATGDVRVESSGTVFIGEGAEEGIPLGTQLKDWLDNHTHDGGGPPDQASPEPSEKVKIT